MPARTPAVCAWFCANGSLGSTKHWPAKFRTLQREPVSPQSESGAPSRRLRAHIRATVPAVLSTGHPWCVPSRRKASCRARRRNVRVMSRRQGQSPSRASRQKYRANPPSRCARRGDPGRMQRDPDDLEARWTGKGLRSRTFLPTVPANSESLKIMSNRAIWNVRLRHVWLATPLKGKRMKKRQRVRIGLEEALQRKSQAARPETASTETQS
jgi:hypothetical protein